MRFQIGDDRHQLGLRGPRRHARQPGGEDCTTDTRNQDWKKASGRGTDREINEACRRERAELSNGEIPQAACSRERQ